MVNVIDPIKIPCESKSQNTGEKNTGEKKRNLQKDTYIARSIVTTKNIWKGNQNISINNLFS